MVRGTGVFGIPKSNSILLDDQYPQFQSVTTLCVALFGPCGCGDLFRSIFGHFSGGLMSTLMVNLSNGCNSGGDRKRVFILSPAHE